MAPLPQKRSNRLSTSLGRTLLRRLEAPRKSYEKRIVNNIGMGAFDYRTIWAPNEKVKTQLSQKGNMVR